MRSSPLLRLLREIGERYSKTPEPGCAAVADRKRDRAAHPWREERQTGGRERRRALLPPDGGGGRGPEQGNDRVAELRFTGPPCT